MTVAVVEEGEGGIALSEIEDEGLGLAHANDHLGVFAAGFDLYFPNPTMNGLGARTKRTEIAKRPRSGERQ